jgi:hypothetical protein
MGYAARVMRGLIIDDVRRRRSQKRGGLFAITSLRTWHVESIADPNSLVRISDALDELAEVDPELAEVIDLKFFCGLSFAEIAPPCGASRNGRFSGTGKRAGSTCIMRSATRVRRAWNAMPALTAERWRAISPYLDQALDLPTADRAAWLESICARDARLAGYSSAPRRTGFASACRASWSSRFRWPLAWR